MSPRNPIGDRQKGQTLLKLPEKSQNMIEINIAVRKRTERKRKPSVFGILSFFLLNFFSLSSKYFNFSIGLHEINRKSEKEIQYLKQVY